MEIELSPRPKVGVYSIRNTSPDAMSNNSLFTTLPIQILRRTANLTSSIQDNKSLKYEIKKKASIVGGLAYVNTSAMSRAKHNSRTLNATASSMNNSQLGQNSKMQKRYHNWIE